MYYYPSFLKVPPRACLSKQERHSFLTQADNCYYSTTRALSFPCPGKAPPHETRKKTSNGPPGAPFEHVLRPAPRTRFRHRVVATPARPANEHKNKQTQQKQQIKQTNARKHRSKRASTNKQQTNDHTSTDRLKRLSLWIAFQITMPPLFPASSPSGFNRI